MPTPFASVSRRRTDPVTLNDLPRLPVRVAAVNDYELVVAGVATLLRRYPDRLLVVDRIVIGDPIDTPIDVALYDTYGRVGLAEQALRVLARTPEVRKVAVFTLDLRDDLVAEAFRWGASAVISKALPGGAIADALVQVAAGHRLRLTGSARLTVDRDLDWPGKKDGLTERESQVLVLCAEGLHNREIAKALYLGTETVKTHLRNAYRKIGAHNRVQASAYVRGSGAFHRYQPADPGASGATDPPPPEER
jgi:DNA-binding NarL/FixJ family response regulator